MQSDSLRNYLRWQRARGQRFAVMADRGSESGHVFADVRATGDLHAVQIVFLSLQPESDQSAQGLPFASDTADLVLKIIKAMNLDLTEVCFAHLVLSQTPAQLMQDQQVSAYRQYLNSELGDLRPRVVLALGPDAARNYLGTDESFETLRGRWHDDLHFERCKVMATYHPRQLLINPQQKRQTWQDLQAIIEYLSHGERS